MPEVPIEALGLTLVMTYGRSGSSRLMELVKLTGANPVAGAFPFEVRSIQYGLLCALGVGEMTAAGAIVCEGMEYHPPVPRCAGEADAAFRNRVVSERGYLLPYGSLDRWPNPSITEKAIGFGLASLVADACPGARFVFVDRDPRDIFLSVLSFNRQRGYESFGAEDGTVMLAERIAKYFREAAEFRAAHEGRTVVISYADLIERPREAVALAAGRRVDSIGPVAGDLGTVSAPGHMTAGSAQESVGRWRREAIRQDEFAILEKARGLLSPHGSPPG